MSRALTERDISATVPCDACAGDGYLWLRKNGRLEELKACPECRSYGGFVKQSHRLRGWWLATFVLAYLALMLVSVYFVCNYVWVPSR